MNQRAFVESPAKHYAYSLYIYIHIYINIYIYIYIYIHTHTYIYYIYVDVYMYEPPSKSYVFALLKKQRVSLFGGGLSLTIKYFYHLPWLRGMMLYAATIVK